MVTCPLPIFMYCFEIGFTKLSGISRDLFWKQLKMSGINGMINRAFRENMRQVSILALQKKENVNCCQIPALVY